MDQCSNPKIWGAFLVTMGALWALSLANVLTFNFWPYMGAIAIVFIGIKMLLPHEAPGRTL